MADIKYKRVLLKLSGESFCEPGGFGIDGSALESIARRIAEISKPGLGRRRGREFPQGRKFFPGQ